jgi:hypothetical protein
VFGNFRYFMSGAEGWGDGGGGGGGTTTRSCSDNKIGTEDFDFAQHTKI